jgi:hypothetical protein
MHPAQIPCKCCWWVQYSTLHLQHPWFSKPFITNLWKLFCCPSSGANSEFVCFHSSSPFDLRKMYGMTETSLT